jgi:hypothetical protein
MLKAEHLYGLILPTECIAAGWHALKGRVGDRQATPLLMASVQVSAAEEICRPLGGRK